MRIRILPYKIGSGGAKALSTSLRESGVDCLRVRPDGRYKPRHRDLLINWGSGAYPEWWVEGMSILNQPQAVSVASNKLLTFMVLSDKNPDIIPPFTRERDEARQWLGEGSLVVGRQTLRGSGGVGVIIFDTPEHLMNTEQLPLYTKYIKKMREFRVHVFKGDVILVQEKKRNLAVEGVNYQVRNHDNGWVFCVEDLEPIPPSCVENAVSAVSAIGLDFGAVDVVWNKKENRSYVLEVNTAPGLVGSTIDIYTNCVLKEVMNHE